MLILISPSDPFPVVDLALEESQSHFSITMQVNTMERHRRVWLHLHRCISLSQYRTKSLHWRQNGRDDVSNHQLLDRLLNRLFRCRSKKTSTLRVTGLCEGNSPVTGEFSAHKASNAENVSIWWRHHIPRYQPGFHIYCRAHFNVRGRFMLKGTYDMTQVHMFDKYLCLAVSPLNSICPITCVSLGDYDAGHGICYRKYFSIICHDVNLWCPFLCPFLHKYVYGYCLSICACKHIC